MGWHIPSCWLCPSPLYVQGCWGAVLPGGVGFWPPSRLRGRALGEAAVGRARRELRAAAKVNSAIAVPRLRVLTGAPVPRAYATGVLPTPPILLFLTRAPVLVFLLGLFWEQPGACSIPFPQGPELRRGQGRAWHCFGHQASMWSWGTGGCLEPGSPHCGGWSTHIISGGRTEGTELLWELQQKRGSRASPWSNESAPPQPNVPQTLCCTPHPSYF